MNFTKKLQCLVVFFVTFRVDGVPVPPQLSDVEWSKILQAIKYVETGNNSGIGVIGDDGRSYGPYQIQENYFLDAKEYDPTIEGTWEDCLTSKELSEKVIKAYISRYLPKNGTPEMIARIHNGGPKGHTKQSTVKYWNKVKEYLN